MTDLLRKLKVLYVEDDLVHREELADYLSRRVGRLYLAEDGDQGYDKFVALQPDLVITDLRMPKASGIELVEKIRLINKTVPIVVLTAMSDKASILQSVKVGILDYVLKPVDVKELMQVIHKAIGTIAAIDVDFGQTHYMPEKLNQLKTALTSLLKSETGKGPVDIRYNPEEAGIEIILVGSLTKYESALLALGKNDSLVEYNRTVFLKDRKKTLEDLVCRHLADNNLQLADLTVNVKDDKCTLKFKRRIDL